MEALYEYVHLETREMRFLNIMQIYHHPVTRSIAGDLALKAPMQNKVAACLITIIVSAVLFISSSGNGYATTIHETGINDRGDNAVVDGGPTAIGGFEPEQSNPALVNPGQHTFAPTVAAKEVAMSGSEDMTNLNTALGGPNPVTKIMDGKGSSRIDPAVWKKAVDRPPMDCPSEGMDYCYPAAESLDRFITLFLIAGGVGSIVIIRKSRK